MSVNISEAVCPYTKNTNSFYNPAFFSNCQGNMSEVSQTKDIGINEAWNKSFPALSASPREC